MKLIDRGGWFQAENATVVGRVKLGTGASVWYGAVLRGDMASITVGDYTNLQDNCVVHTDPGKDMTIGRHVTVGHMAMIHCRSVGDRCLIGIHSILLDGAVIGEGSLIAAGALVRENQVIPPRSIVVGLPGKVVGQLTDAQWDEAQARAMRYYATARRHVDGKVDPDHLQDYLDRLPRP
ncbi:MAG TPA: gamma carbonic anhydrase family protein [Planctomycetota bacterium]|nr:gamma carbonic anhydrase family protein [Planctomycetota bacterium]